MHRVFVAMALKLLFSSQNIYRQAQFAIVSINQLTLTRLILDALHMGGEIGMILLTIIP